MKSIPDQLKLPQQRFQIIMQISRGLLYGVCGDQLNSMDYNLNMMSHFDMMDGHIYEILTPSDVMVFQSRYMRHQSLQQYTNRGPIHKTRTE